MNPADDLKQGFRLGDWDVRPLEGVLVGVRGPRHLQPKTVDVLLCLAGRAGEVVQRDEILREVWGDRAVSDEPLTRCIGELRRELDDHREDPVYIQTIPKRGYRLVAPVEPLTAPAQIDFEPSVAAEANAPRIDWWARGSLGALTLVIVILIVIVATLRDGREDASDKLAATRDNSIAVLPFEDISSDGTNAWLGRGIAEDVLNLLVRIENLEVSARTSSFRAALQSLDIRDIGQDLNVHYVLEGSIRREGDRIKIAAQLIDARTGYHVWSHVYDRTTSDVFAIQGEIAERVVKELQLAMPTQLKFKDNEPPTKSVDAYDYYLQARSFLNRPSSQGSLQSAQRFFVRALEFDPQFGLAYAGLCSARVRQMAEHEASNSLKPAQEACANALTFASDAPGTHAAMGELYRVTGDPAGALEEFKWVVDRHPREVDARLGMAEVYAEMGDNRQADATFRTAIEISPNYGLAYSAYGMFLFDSGRAEDAIQIYKQLVQLEPTYSTAYNNLGAAHFMAGDFDRAAAAYREVVAREPTAIAYSNIGTNYYYLGRFDDAEVMYREAISLTPEDPQLWGNLGDALAQIPSRQEGARQAYQQARKTADAELAVNPEKQTALAGRAHYCASLGDQDCATESITRALGLADTDFYTLYFAALVGIRQGNMEQAIKDLARAVELGFPPVLMNADPLLAPLRGSGQLANLVPEAVPQLSKQ